MIIDCLSYSSTCYSLGELLTYPSPDNYSTSFLYLLLQLLPQHIDTPLFEKIIHFIMALMKVLGYPVPRESKLAMQIIYPMLMVLCNKVLNGEVSDDSTFDIIQLLLAMIMQSPGCVETQGRLNLDVLQVLLHVVSLESEEMAALPMDALLMLVVSVHGVSEA